MRRTVHGRLGAAQLRRRLPPRLVRRCHSDDLPVPSRAQPRQCARRFPATSPRRGTIGDRECQMVALQPVAAPLHDCQAQHQDGSARSSRGRRRTARLRGEFDGFVVVAEQHQFRFVVEVSVSGVGPSVGDAGDNACGGDPVSERRRRAVGCRRPRCAGRSGSRLAEQVGGTGHFEQASDNRRRVAQNHTGSPVCKIGLKADQRP